MNQPRTQPDILPDILPDNPDILVFSHVREAGHSGHSPFRGMSGCPAHAPMSGLADRSSTITRAAFGPT